MSLKICFHLLFIFTIILYIFVNLLWLLWWFWLHTTCMTATTAITIAGRYASTAFWIIIIFFYCINLYIFFNSILQLYLSTFIIIFMKLFDHFYCLFNTHSINHDVQVNPSNCILYLILYILILLCFIFNEFMLCNKLPPELK